MQSKLIPVASAIAFAAAGSSGQIIALDFESVPHGTLLDDHFVSQGVDFAGSMQLLDSTLAHTGTKEAFGPPFVAPPTRIHAVSDPFEMFGAWFRGHGPGDVLTIEAFDASDTSLGSVFFSPPGSGLSHGYLEIGTADTAGLPFASVEISITSVGFSMDDVGFSLVPTPSAAMALAVGLSAVGPRRRR